MVKKPHYPRPTVLQSITYLARAAILAMSPMRYEKSIRRAVEIAGVGLHSGAEVRMRILPAPAGTGIVFVRTDLNHYRVPATWEYIARVSYATSLLRKSVLISTTEHLLSVFYSMGIDNAIVELDNLEVPILDGSGAPFVNLIAEAGVEHTRKQRRYLRIIKPVRIEANGKSVAILPSDRFELSCHVYFNHPWWESKN